MQEDKTVGQSTVDVDLQILDFSIQLAGREVAVLHDVGIRTIDELAAGSYVFFQIAGEECIQVVAHVTNVLHQQGNLCFVVYISINRSVYFRLKGSQTA